MRWEREGPTGFRYVGGMERGIERGGGGRVGDEVGGDGFC